MAKSTFDKLWRLDTAVVVLYAAITLFGVFHHEPWRDEAQPWLIARDAPSGAFISIMFNNYDRHPALWYVLLRPLARLGLPYLSQFLLHWLLAVAAVSVFIFWAPFSRVTKYLFAFSYLMLFEYAVVARNYTVAILLIFLIAKFYEQRFARPLLFSGLVFLLFNASYLCFALGMALILIYLVELYGQSPRSRKCVWGVALMALGGILVFWQGVLLPEDHFNYGLSASLQYPMFIHSLGSAFIPVSTDVSIRLRTAIGLAIVGFTIVGHMRKPAILLVLLSSYGTLLYIFGFLHPSSPRHSGIMLIVLLFVYWIAPFCRDKDWLPLQVGWLREGALRRCRQNALTITRLCLLLAISYSFHAYRYEYRFRFSGGEQIASVIREVEQRFSVEQGFVFAGDLMKTNSILPYLPAMEFWDPCMKEFGTYFINTKDYLVTCSYMTPQEMARLASDRFGGLDRVFFITSAVDHPLAIGDYEVRVVSSTDVGIWGSGREEFVFYRLESD